MNQKNYQAENKYCQMLSFPNIMQDRSSKRTDDLPLLTKARLFFRRHLDLETRQKVKKLFFLDRLWQSAEFRQQININEKIIMTEQLNLLAGDRVRIRSKEEILSTLDSTGKLKGCSFIGEMWQFCGTTQKVLKPVNRFVDERNYKIVYAKGLVLLEGVMCAGTDFYGNCDRSCLFFWREEWLERLQQK